MKQIFQSPLGLQSQVFSELSIIPSPWNAFVSQCRGVGYSGNNNTRGSWKNGLSIFILLTYNSTSESFHFILGANGITVEKDTKAATLLSPASFFHKVGTRPKKQGLALLSKAFPPSYCWDTRLYQGVGDGDQVHSKVRLQGILPIDN